MRKVFGVILVFMLSRQAVALDALVQDPVTDADHPPAAVELAIPSSGSRMPGLLYLANGPGPHPTVVFLHGIPGNEKNLDIAQALRRAGFNTLFFHYRGAWGAEGEYSVLGVDDDALAALDFLREPAHARDYRVDTRRLSLLGHSLGGFAALRAGSQDDRLTCVAALSPANFAVLAEGLRQQDPDAGEFIAYADTLYMLAGFDGSRMREELLGAAPEELDPLAFAAGLAGKSVLLVVGDRDRVTPRVTMFDPVAAAYRKAPGIRLRTEVLAGDHGYSSSRIALSRLLLDWFGEHCQ